MNMKVYMCKKCNKKYTQLKRGSLCPYCGTYNPDYATFVEQGLKLLTKIITKK